MGGEAFPVDDMRVAGRLRHWILAYRMLVGDVSERIPATRLVIEPDASCLPTMGMASLETPFIFNAARSPVFDLREGKAVSRWRNAFWRCGKRIFWTECWTG